jgi:hypothetical protein
MIVASLSLPQEIVIEHNSFQGIPIMLNIHLTDAGMVNGVYKLYTSACISVYFVQVLHIYKAKEGIAKLLY